MIVPDDIWDFGGSSKDEEEKDSSSEPPPEEPQNPEDIPVALP